MPSRILLAILVGIILLLASPLLDERQDLSFAEYATVQAQDKVALQSAEADYLTVLRRAAQEPVEALNGLDAVIFSDSPFAEDARGLAQAIRLAALQGNNAYSLTAVGQAFARLEKWDLSLVALQNAVKADPEYSEAWAYLAEALQQTGKDGTEAIAEAQQLDPLSLSANLFAALYWQRQGDFDEAGRYLNIARLVAPDNASISIQLGHNAVLGGDVPGARIYYEQALVLNPDDVDILKALAAYSLDNQIYVDEIGLPAARRTLVLAPRDPDALVLMGRAIFLSSGQDEQAKTLFQNAMTLDPNHAGARLHMGLYLIADEEYLLAREHLELIVKNAPNSIEAAIAEQVLEDYYR
jgi:tetratricopeptide (TPR) repeat protein